MSAPKLHSSQELILHQVTAEQGLSSPATSSRAFPQAPSSLRPGALGAPPFSPSTPLGQTPGGSSSTASASIVRPEVRFRPVWYESLQDIQPFTLPRHHLCSSGDSSTGRTTSVRYVLDKHDRNWIAQRTLHGGHGLVDSSSAVVRGKTGSVGTSASFGVYSALSASVFEDLFTAFEMTSYDHPEVSLERLNNVDSCYIADAAGHLEPAIIEEIRQYWIRKRNALGGHIPCIPALRPDVREDNQSALCHSDILGDCPLPFKNRDWRVLVVERKLPRCESNTRCNIPRKRSREVGSCDNIWEQEEVSARQFVALSSALGKQLLHRERILNEHIDMTMYELAVLRSLSTSIPVKEST